MAKYTLFIILSFASIALMAQNSTQTKKNSAFSNGLGAADYSFNVGSQVGTSFNNSYYLSNHFSPNAKINLTKKLSLVVGVGVSYTQMNNIPIYNNELGKEFINASQTSFYTYASGIYKLNSKVNVNATILLEDAMINSPGTPTLQKQYKDVSVGINYNVTPHFTINAQMQFSDRPQYGYNRSYSGFGVGSPYGFTPFF